MTTTAAVAAEAESWGERRTFMVGVRLALAANTTLQLAMLFAYVYLRANNFGGGWRPDGISDLAPGPEFLTNGLQVVALLVIVPAIAAARRPGAAARGLTAIALVFGIASVVSRVYQQYHLGDGWAITNGTYAAVSEIWMSILIVEAVLGCLWLLALVVPGRRVMAGAVTAVHLRGFAEFWGYLTVLAIGVWLLVRFV